MVRTMIHSWRIAISSQSSWSSTSVIRRRTMYPAMWIGFVSWALSSACGSSPYKNLSAISSIMKKTASLDLIIVIKAPRTTTSIEQLLPVYTSKWCFNNSQIISRSSKTMKFSMHLATGSLRISACHPNVVHLTLSLTWRKIMSFSRGKTRRVKSIRLLILATKLKICIMSLVCKLISSQSCLEIQIHAQEWSTWEIKTSISRRTELQCHTVAMMVRTTIFRKPEICLGSKEMPQGLISKQKSTWFTHLKVLMNSTQI